MIYNEQKKILVLMKLHRIRFIDVSTFLNENPSTISSRIHGYSPCDIKKRKEIENAIKNIISERQDATLSAKVKDNGKK